MVKRKDMPGQAVKKPVVVSLFTGAGGLDLGLEAAGFAIHLCVEIDSDARKTLEANRPGWKLAEPGDILDAEPADLVSHAGLEQGEVTLLAGGLPVSRFQSPRTGPMVALVVCKIRGRRPCRRISTLLKLRCLAFFCSRTSRA